MPIVQTKIVNCKTASIRKHPWKTSEDSEVVGEKRFGESIEINPDNVCFDWVDRKFYRTINPRGWIHEGVIDYGHN